jgi:hypothetical protein
MGRREIRPVLDQDQEAHAAAEAAVAQFAAELQEGVDASDADIYDRSFAADVMWGSPYGATLTGFSELNAVHRMLMAGRAAPPSDFEVVGVSRSDGERATASGSRKRPPTSWWSAMAAGGWPPRRTRRSRRRRPDRDGRGDPYPLPTYSKSRSRAWRGGGRLARPQGCTATVTPGPPRAVSCRMQERPLL